MRPHCLAVAPGMAPLDPRQAAFSRRCAVLRRVCMWTPGARERVDRIMQLYAARQHPALAAEDLHLGDPRPAPLQVSQGQTPWLCNLKPRLEILAKSTESGISLGSLKA